ncbi:hypothetical protein U9M48_033747 [Paspalum notatum var. saurae]|uniref:Uncharacterized protein n=1 Tax=Paspalum notatum var. saurae TaxID=547442 RepID=A0AAQ3U918_PASNO
MAPPPGIVEVRCAGCGETLEVEPGLTEFACPDCGTHQALPPELMPRRPRRALPLPGRCAPLSAVPSRITCGGCSAVLSVPHGQGRLACPLCGTELAASPAAAVSVVAPPAAVPITPSRPAQPSVVISVTEQVCPGPSSQLTHAGPFQKVIQPEQTHGQLLRHSIREDPFTSSRAETGTGIPLMGRLENEPANPLSHGHIEPLDEIISRPSKKNSRSIALPDLPDSYPARKVHEEHPNQSMYASEAQEMPSFYSDMAEDRSPNDTVTVHSKQKAGNVVVPSILKQGQTKFLNQDVDRQQAGEIPNNMFHADKLQVDFSNKAENSKKSVKGSKGRPKRKNNILTNSSTELPHLRRSKRLIKGSHDHDLLDIEPIEKIDASPNQNLSEALGTGRTLADSDPSSPARFQFPHGGSNEWDGVDATTPPALHHGAQQAEQFSHTQMYSPETRWTLPVASSNSWHDHEMSHESFGGVGQLDRSYAEVHSDPIEMQHQDMHGQLAQQACSKKVQDASCSDVLSGSISNSSKKRRGRAPEKLMEPREEADRPVLMPSGTDWNVHPPCPKLATTLSLLVKQNYPGIYVSNDTSGNGQSHEHVVYHWHQCPPDTRATVLDEFLKRYKWSPGHEEECQKIFDRKAVRQLTNLFCYEKQRVRQILAAKKAKKSSLVHSARGEMGLEEDNGREDSDEQRGDKSVVVLEHEDPLKWKPFVPVWMKPKWWEMLCDHWAKDEVMKMSYQQRKNRNSGTPPCNAARLRKITLYEQIVGLDNGGKLAVDIDSPTEILKESVGERVCRTEDTRDQPDNETQDTQLRSHSVQKQVGSGERGRYFGGIDARKKAQHKSLSKSPPVCVSKQGQQLMFTKEQVQEMINQALQGLNEAWEKKFLSLERKMPSMSSSCIVPNVAVIAVHLGHLPRNIGGVKESSLAIGRSKRCHLAQQDTLDSMDVGEDPSVGDDPDYQDDEEHSS